LSGFWCFAVWRFQWSCFAAWSKICVVALWSRVGMSNTEINGIGVVSLICCRSRHQLSMCNLGHFCTGKRSQKDSCMIYSFTDDKPFNKTHEIPQYFLFTLRIHKTCWGYVFVEGGRAWHAHLLSF
jgi:hypothetical protein